MDRKTFAEMVMSTSSAEDIIDCNGKKEISLYDTIPEAVRRIDIVVEQNLYQMPQNAVYGWLNARKDILEAAGKGGDV